MGAMMVTALDFVQGDVFGFEHTTEFVRQRAALVVDPYDPDSVVEDWGSPSEITLTGYLASSSSNEQTSEAREQVVTTKQLVIDDPRADVRRGDRIKHGDHLWSVEGFPETDQNPFTRWQPTLVANLKEWEG